MYIVFRGVRLWPYAPLFVAIRSIGAIRTYYLHPHDAPRRWLTTQPSGHSSRLATQCTVVARTRKRGKNTLVSDSLRKQRVKLLGHVRRCEADGPLAQVTFQNDGQINTYDKRDGKRRVGRPRGQWTEETMVDAWEAVEGYPQDVTECDEILWLFIQAFDRTFSRNKSLEGYSRHKLESRCH